MLHTKSANESERVEARCAFDHSSKHEVARMRFKDWIVRSACRCSPRSKRSRAYRWGEDGRAPGRFRVVALCCGSLLQSHREDVIIELCVGAEPSRQHIVERIDDRVGDVIAGQMVDMNRTAPPGLSLVIAKPNPATKTFPAESERILPVAGI